MPQRKLRKPVFAALSTDECWTLLSRNHVGRLAFVNQGVVDIEPVHYVAAPDAWLFVRSAEGTKLEVLAHRTFVAFERALRALRSFFPATMTKDDPTPWRRRVYGIHVNAVTGRVAEQRGPRSGRRPLNAPPSTSRRRRLTDGS